MRITSDYNRKYDNVDITDIIDDLQQKHRTVYWTHINDQIYIYKPLGRKDHKEISLNKSFSDLDREDEVCKRCLLYPEIDIEEQDAGIVTTLYNKIMINSLLDDINKKAAVMDYYRSEMYELDNQITCIINEAFPEYDIEEIENWGIERTAKYLSRAEFKLQNFRGARFDNELLDAMQKQQPQHQQVEVDKMSMSKTEEAPSIKNNKSKLTAEKLRELQAKFPEIRWAEDEILNHGDMVGDSFNTVPVALRTMGE